MQIWVSTFQDFKTFNMTLKISKCQLRMNYRNLGNLQGAAAVVEMEMGAVAQFQPQMKLSQRSKK